MTTDRNARLVLSGGNPALRFERQLPHSNAAVWRAITESDVLSEWSPADLQGTRATGEPIKIVSPHGRFPPVDGKFTIYEPEQTLEYTWGNETLRWDLRATHEGCCVTFTNVLDDDAVSIGAADIAAAWHACLDVLEFILAGQSPPFTADERFTQISAEYSDRFAQNDEPTA